MLAFAVSKLICVIYLVTAVMDKAYKSCIY